jgi:hypothetical protein
VPFLRVLRDKRGYETTFLMHWFREGQRQRSRILYVFRTPPGVRVGRHVFEPATIREIEQQHPDIEFDWRSLVDNQQVVDAAPEPRRPRKRKRSDEEPASPAAAAPAPAATTVESRAGAEAASPAAPARAAQPRITIPTAIDGTSPEEQIAWLRQWHPIIRERVPHRTHDPARREALFALADRLNPDLWTGEEAIAQGLRDAAEALMRLSRVFAKRRRRSRRGSGRREGGNGENGGNSGGSGEGPAAT